MDQKRPTSKGSVVQKLRMVQDHVREAAIMTDQVASECMSNLRSKSPVETHQVLENNKYNVNPQELSFMKKLSALRMYQAKCKQSKIKKFDHHNIPATGYWDSTMKSFDFTNLNSEINLHNITKIKPKIDNYF